MEFWIHECDRARSRFGRLSVHFLRHRAMRSSSATPPRAGASASTVRASTRSQEIIGVTRARRAIDSDGASSSEGKFLAAEQLFERPVERFEPPKRCGFRARARFGVRRDDCGAVRLVGEVAGAGAREMDADGFEDGCDGVRRAIRTFTDALAQEDTSWSVQARESVLAVSFLSNRDGSEAVVASTHSPVGFAEGSFREFAEAMMRENTSVVGCVHRRRRRASVLVGERDYVIETIRLQTRSRAERLVRFIHREGSFSNPNVDVAEQTGNFLCELCEDLTENGTKGMRFVELYAGCGNHTVTVAPYFLHGAYAVEIDENLVKAARENFAMNGLDDSVARVVCAPAEEWIHTSDARDERYRASSTVALVDPPRNGLDRRTLDFITSAFDVVIYVACDYESMYRDIVDDENGFSRRGFDLKRLAVFDHVPTSARWIETVGLFVRSGTSRFVADEHFWKKT